MNKIYLAILLLFIIPAVSLAEGLVPCGNPGQPACTIGHFFKLLYNVFDFMIRWIALPLASLMIIAGGVMILVSAGNPGLAGMGKKTIIAVIIGLVLVFGAWQIIAFIMNTLGYNANWNTLY